MKVILISFFLVTCAQAADIPSDCPFIGNLDSGIYHVKGEDRDYAKVMERNKSREDNRICFQTEHEAKAYLVTACPLNTRGEVIHNCKKDEKIERPFVRSRSQLRKDRASGHK